VFHLLRWLSLLLGTIVRVLLYPRRALVVENLALRQQLAVVMQREPHVRLTPMDRLFWVGLRAAWRRWPSVLVIVTPKTVVARPLPFSVALAVDDDLVGVVSEAVDGALGEDGVVEQRDPFVDGAVGGDLPSIIHLK